MVVIPLFVVEKKTDYKKIVCLFSMKRGGRNENESKIEGNFKEDEKRFAKSK